MRRAGTFYINPIVNIGGRLNPNNVFSYVKGMVFRKWIRKPIHINTVDTTNDYLSVDWNHGYSLWQSIRFTTDGTLPSPLAAATTYYAIPISSTSFQVASSVGGGAINITTTGSGNHNVFRYNGNAEFDLIDTAPYVVESIIRDYLLTEIKLKIDTLVSSTKFTCKKLFQAYDDAYMSAICINRTTGSQSVISGYTADTGEITLVDADTSMAAGDDIEIVDIFGDEKIDMLSFDSIGNTSNGSRKSWKSELVISDSITSEDLISMVLFESWCILHTSGGKYKIITLDEKETVDGYFTAANIVNIEGREAFSSAYTPIDNLYNSFLIKYDYCYGLKDFRKTIIVNKNGYSADLTSIGDTEKNLCDKSVREYGFERMLEYGLITVHDRATAELFAQKAVRWFSKRRLIVFWIMSPKDGIAFDIGDQVTITLSNYMPSTIGGGEDKHRFAIVRKNTIPMFGAPHIEFTLIDIS